VRNICNGADALGDLHACCGRAIGILVKSAQVTIAEVPLLNITFVLVRLVANSVVEFGRVLIVLELLALEPDRDDTITSEG
jgi:hypothetical protein